MHSHANDVAIAMNCVMEYGLQHQDIALHIAPLYHVGGLQAFFIPHLMVGATNVVLSRYSAASTLAAIAQERITTLFAVPTQIQELLAQEKLQGSEPWSLRMITTGGAALSAASMARVQRELCAQIYNGYGMTEASLTLLLHPQDALRRLGSCGKPTLISACRIAAPEGEVGQLLVQGPQVTAGYWNNPEETAAKIRHGWLYTGDLFSRDEQGFYYFRGRIDDMIVSGGENIYPREVEEVLHRCAGVQQAAVVGLPDAKWGAVVTAFVVRAGDLTAEALDRHCRESNELAAFKRPRRIIFLDELPTNPSGKVLKRQLLADYACSQNGAATI
jgi:fatty-acyl-CoA synthase